MSIIDPSIIDCCLIGRPESLLKQIQAALKQVDILVTSGGVSMGEKVSTYMDNCN